VPQSTAPDLQKFWSYTEQLESSLVVITPPPSSETVLDVLGAIPLKAEAPAGQAAVSAQLAMEYLKAVYAQVSQQAVMAAMTAGGER
jgi:uncharacterized Zn finger protein